LVAAARRWENLQSDAVTIVAPAHAPAIIAPAIQKLENGR